MIDVDNLFEEFFKNYLKENLGKKTEEEIENSIPEIYESFGKTPNKELGMKSPVEYFQVFSDDELIKELKENVLIGTEPSSYLCDEIERRDGINEKLAEIVSVESGDELSTYAVNMLGEDLNVCQLERFVDLIADKNSGESLTEALTEYLRDKGDLVKEKIISTYFSTKQGKINFAEIMSRMSPNDRILDILCKELKTDGNNIALYAAYIARYGDDRAMGSLEEVIERDGISYYDFKELKNAIEELGGEYLGKFKGSKYVN